MKIAKQKLQKKPTTYTHSCFGHGQKCNVHFGRFVVSVAATFFPFFSFGFCAELLALSKFYLEWFFHSKKAIGSLVLPLSNYTLLL